MAIPENYIDKITKDGQSRMISPAADMVRVNSEEYEGDNLGDVLNEIADAVADAASSADLSGLFAAAAYNSTTKEINFLDKNNTVVATIDAKPFVRDGMVSSVSLSNGVLTITFNTDAGKEPISVSLGDLFNANNYYTKTDADGKFVVQVSGKGLSSNDYTNADKAAVGTIADKADKTTVPEAYQPRLIAGTGISINSNNQISVETGAVAAGEDKPVSGKDVKEAIDAATPTIDPTTRNWVIGNTPTEYPSRGEKGDNAPVPYVGQNGNWWVGGVDTEVPAQGEKGDTVVIGEGQTFELANSLLDESTSKGLTAAMGKRLGDAVFDGEVEELDTTAGTLENVYLDVSDSAIDKWSRDNSNAANSRYKGKFFNIAKYNGWNYKIVAPLVTSGNSSWYQTRFAFLKDNTHNIENGRNTPSYSDETGYTDSVYVGGNSAQRVKEGVVPSDVNYIYIYCYNSTYTPQNFPPQLIFTNPNPSSRIERLEDLTDGVDDIKEGWFAVEGGNYDYHVPANDCWVKQTVDDYGTTYSGSNATTMRAFPKSASQSIAAASPSDCYKVDDLPDRVLTIKMASLESGYWAFRLVYYTSALGFISRTSAILVKDTDNWQKIINDIPSNAAYFKILMSKNVNGTLDADTYTLNDGDITFVKRSISQQSMPDRVAALEESAVANAAKDTIRVLSYNIGHFAMGNSSSSTISDQIPDGDTAYPHSNYDVQLARWKSRIQNVCADVMLFCEYSTVFGTKNGAQVTTAACGILDGYPHIAYGTTTTSNYFVNALISKFTFIGSAEKVDLGSLISTKAFMEVGTIAINGVYVKIASCHLTPNSEGNENTRLSRLAEINNIIKYFANDDHVIIGGDFNTTGPMITPRDWALGAEEFNPFLYGFDEEGTHYEGGYTLANHGNWGNLPTYTSTGEKSPGVPTSFIDNIIVKGFRMSGVVVIDDGNLTDHCGIMCDLTLID